VQRWEQEEACQCIACCTRGGALSAYKGELDEWWEKRHAELEPQRESGNGKEAEPIAPNPWRRAPCGQRQQSSWRSRAWLAGG